MPSQRDLAILKQVRQGDEQNKCDLVGWPNCSQPAVVPDAGWTVTTESVPAEDELITNASDINISKEHKPSRSPLL
jgi:hypothetical protein